MRDRGYFTFQRLNCDLRNEREPHQLLSVVRRCSRVSQKLMRTEVGSQGWEVIAAWPVGARHSVRVWITKLWETNRSLARPGPSTEHLSPASDAASAATGICWQYLGRGGGWKPEYISHRFFSLSSALSTLRVLDPKCIVYEWPRLSTGAQETDGPGLSGGPLADTPPVASTNMADTRAPWLAQGETTSGKYTFSLSICVFIGYIYTKALPIIFAVFIIFTSRLYNLLSVPGPGIGYGLAGARNLSVLWPPWPSQSHIDPSASERSPLSNQSPVLRPATNRRATESLRGRTRPG